MKRTLLDAEMVIAAPVAGFLPWYHLLPRFLYKAILKLFGESEIVIANLMEIKDTGISTRRFERILRLSGLSVEKQTLFLINPIYKFKFGWKARKQSALISAIPVIRDIFTTCVYYLVSA